MEGRGVGGGKTSQRQRSPVRSPPRALLSAWSLHVFPVTLWASLPHPKVGGGGGGCSLIVSLSIGHNAKGVDEKVG